MIDLTMYGDYLTAAQVEQALKLERGIMEIEFISKFGPRGTVFYSKVDLAVWVHKSRPFEKIRI